MDNDQSFRLTFLSWRWTFVTYCFLVLFHLFPSFLLSGQSVLRYQPLFFNLPNSFSLFPWLGVGIVVVCTYVGHRASGIIMAEAGIASMLYVATLFFALPNDWPRNFTYRVIHTPWIAFFLLVTFLAGLGGAAFGKWLQLRKQRKQLAS